MSPNDRSGAGAGADAVRVPAPAPTLNWVDQEASLNYRIGDIQVGHIEVPVRTPTNYFWELDDPIDLSVLAPSSGRAILLRSLPIRERLPRITHRPGAILYAPKTYRRYLTDLKLTPAEYLSRMSGKSRSTLKRKVRKFEQMYGPEIFREYRTEQDIAPYFEAAHAVSSVTYQERLLDFGLPRSAEFIELTRQQARAGTWRGYVLFARGAPIAYVHCPLLNGIALYAYLGFDPEYADASPGTVLQWLLMERMFADEAILWFDFTEGEGPHKEFFSTHNWQCADVWLFSPSLRNRLLVLAHSGLDSVGVVAGKVLDRLGLKRHVRKLLRRQ